MRNIKDKAVANLDELFSNVTDSYPRQWAELPAVQITEEENNVYEAVERDGQLIEAVSYIRFRIDIYHNASTSASALLVEQALGISGLGFKRTSCKDIDDPSGIKHKQIRYEGYVNADNDFVEWSRQ